MKCGGAWYNYIVKNKTVIGTIIGFLFLILGIVAFYLFSGDHVKQAPVYLYLLVSIAAVVVLIAVVFIVLAAKGKIVQREPDYRMLFIFGVIWIPIGFSINNPGFWVIGLVLMVVGLANKDKWKSQPRFSELPRAQRNFKIAALILLGLIVAAGLVAWYLAAR